MSRRRYVVVSAVAGALVLGSVALALWRDRADEKVAPRGPAPYELVARAAAQPLAGDVEHGRRLYVMNCASCHGVEADGTGPASDFLWPLPRDHRDAAYMLSRSDEQLFKAVAHGGRGVSRSYLMPPWNDVFDRFETWNLVAYMRSLTQPLPEGVVRASYHQVLLSSERHESVAGLGLPRLASFIRCLGVRETEDTEEEFVRSLMLFARVPAGAGSATLALTYAPDGRLIGATTFPQVHVRGATDDAVDRFVAALLEGRRAELPSARDLVERLTTMIETARGAMAVLLQQEREDTLAADELGRRYYKEPTTLPVGQRAYIQNCGACHGFTGRNVGPMVMERDAWPRMLADGSVMARLSDGYVRSLIRKGGLHWNLSGVMPAHPGLTDGEVDAITEHVRSLGDPRANGRCPCVALGSQCGGRREGDKCCCVEGQRPEQLCSNMKR